MSIVQDGGGLVEESDSDLSAFMNNREFIHYAGMLVPARPGFGECIEQLEYSYFQPGTPRNDLFHLRVIPWEDILWGCGQYSLL